VSSVARTLSDGTVIARRNLIKLKRVPEILVFVLLSPIMFVLLFAYVFGGAIDPGDGTSYRVFLIGGIFAQTIVFGSSFTGAGLAEDMQKGIIDRFRSLPMSRSAVLLGRTVSDISYNLISLVVMSLTGLLVGWRITSSIQEAAAAYLLLVLFGFALSWIMAYVGLMVPSPEVINNASFMVIMPLTFISNAFVPIESFPTALGYFAAWNPVSAVTQASRELFGNIPEGVPAPDYWSLQHPAVYTLIWVVVILAIFVPLSVRRFQRTSS
jgi:ABC-2 type transport system permease protein